MTYNEHVDRPGHLDQFSHQFQPNISDLPQLWIQLTDEKLAANL